MNHKPPAINVTSAPAATTTKPWSLAGVKLFGDDGFNFRDVLDLINPIQHIPLIGNIYRNLTGDLAAPAIRIAGGALFGGPLGAAFAAANVVMKQIIKPALDSAPLAQPDTAIAARSAPTESRGGWMVQHSHTFPLPANALRDAGKPLAAANPVEIKQTYGLAESEDARRHFFGSFHLMA